MMDDKWKKGEKGQERESHQKFLIKPQELRKVGKAMVVHGEVSELNLIKS